MEDAHTFFCLVGLYFHLTIGLLSPQKSLPGGDAMKVMRRSSHEETSNKQRKTTVLYYGSHGPLDACWACLRWGQRGLQVGHLTYLLRRLCLSRSFLGVSCKSQLMDFFFFEEVESLRISKQKGLRNSVSGFGAKPHIVRTAAMCRNVRASD